MTVRILINAINYAPELAGIGKYTGEMGEWLAALGWDVHVVTAPPYYPEWLVQCGYSSWRYRSEIVAGVKVLRCPLWVPRAPSGVKRILHLLSFAISSFPVLIWKSVVWRPHAVFVVEPPIMCAPGAWLAGRLAGGEAWLHIQDFEVDAAFELGILRPGRLQGAIRGLERWLMQRFDRVSTISDRMLDRLIEKGVARERITLFPNWVDTTEIYPITGPTAYRTQFGIGPDTKLLLYSGNMGEKQGLEILIELAKELSEQDVELILCGDGTARRRLEQAAMGLNNVRFLPLQPVERLNELLNTADIHLLPQRADAADLVMPSKLTAMLASGKPVVATAHADTQVANVVSGCGIVVPPGDVGSLVRAVRELMSDSGRHQELGRNAREYALTHWEKNHVLSEAFGLLQK